MGQLAQREIRRFLVVARRAVTPRLVVANDSAECQSLGRWRRRRTEKTVGLAARNTKLLLSHQHMSGEESVYGIPCLNSKAAETHRGRPAVAVLAAAGIQGTRLARRPRIPATLGGGIAVGEAAGSAVLWRVAAVTAFAAASPVGTRTPFGAGVIIAAGEGGYGGIPTVNWRRRPVSPRNETEGNDYQDNAQKNEKPNTGLTRFRCWGHRDREPANTTKQEVRQRGIRADCHQACCPLASCRDSTHNSNFAAPSAGTHFSRCQCQPSGARVREDDTISMR